MNDILIDDFNAKDYGYEYRIIKDNEQIGDIYFLKK